MNRSGEGFAAPGDPRNLQSPPVKCLKSPGVEFRKAALDFQYDFHSPLQLGDFPGFPFNLARVANCANLLIKNAREIFSHRRQKPAKSPRRFCKLSLSV